MEPQPAEFIFTASGEGMSLDALPLERVAAYLRSVAELLGSAENVHLAAVRAGSVTLAARVDPPAVNRVRERLADASREEAGGALTVRRKLDAMLAEDSASGTLAEAGAPRNVIEFPGVHSRTADLPAFWQPGELRGELVRLEGEDDTKHGTLIGATGPAAFRCNDELARVLRHRLWELIQVTGRGRWRRGGDGTWQLLDFEAESAQPIEDEPIGETIARLRARGGFGLNAEALAELRKLSEA